MHVKQNDIRGSEDLVVEKKQKNRKNNTWKRLGMKDSVFSIFISFFNFLLTLREAPWYMHRCTMPYNPDMAATNLITQAANYNIH